jgi:hypothetical protein
MASTAVNQAGVNKQIDKKLSSEQPPVAIKKTGLVRRLFRKLLRPFVFLLILIAVLGAALAGAVRYKFVDLEQLDSRWGFSKYPLAAQVAQLLKQNLPEQSSDQGDPAVDSSIPPQATPPLPPVADVLPKPSARVPAVQIDDTELKNQAALQLAAEQKRLARVSRLYDVMKAEEAAPILNELDDETVILIFSKMEEERVAKIMTLLEPRRSARLSDAMLKGRVTS